MDYITNLRRKFHAYPELGNLEYNTHQEIIKNLKAANIPYKTAGTGIIARLDLCKDKTVAFRADMDALPVSEANDVLYKSKIDGIMHACGHDGHLSVLLTFITWAAENKEKLNSNLVFIFQPAEEITGGAVKMIENGALENVDEIYAIHLSPEIDGGLFGLKSGMSMAGVWEFDIDFFGQSCHVADYKKGKDAIKCCTELLNTDFLPKSLTKDMIFHCGKITGGYARNIVADYCQAECTLRFFDKKHKEKFLSLLDKTLKYLSVKYNVKYKIDTISEYIPLVNDTGCIEKIRKLAECVDIGAKFSAEDFAFYLEKKKGCLVWLGVKDENHSAPLHSPYFDFEEKFLLNGVELFINLVS